MEVALAVGCSPLEGVVITIGVLAEDTILGGCQGRKVGAGVLRLLVGTRQSRSDALCRSQRAVCNNQGNNEIRMTRRRSSKG